VRIERLWGDVTIQVGSFWHEQFTALEIRYGLDVNNSNHLWLLHLLFLGAINNHLTAFADGWNHHVIQIRDGPNRSPLDMFGFDMLVHGLRGDEVPMSYEELEVFGVDWEGLRDENILESHRRNNPTTEQATSWIGHVGPPEHLNEVPVHPLEGPTVNSTDSHVVLADIDRWLEFNEDASVEAIWSYALAIARRQYGDLF